MKTKNIWDFDIKTNPNYNWNEFKKKYIAEHGSLGYTPATALGHTITDTEMKIYWGRCHYFRQKDEKDGKEAFFEATKGNFLVSDADALARAGRFPKMPPITPADLEIIPRDDWAPLMELWGVDIPQVNHAAFDVSKAIVKENFTPRSKTCLIVNCGNSKPVYFSARYAVLKKLNEIYDFDLWIEEQDIVPFEWSVRYPWRWLQWPHAYETDEQGMALFERSLDSINELIPALGYERCVIMSKPNDFYTSNVETFKKHFTDERWNNIELHLSAEDNDFINELRSKFGKGLAVTRVYSRKDFLEKYFDKYGIKKKVQ